VYRVELLPSAARALEKLPTSMQRRIARRIDRLVDEPRPRGAEKVRGAADIWRIRIGDYRILYQVDDDRLVVLVIKLGHRSRIYRQG
jgi:mRNA interferase RelE/StbE